MKVKAKLNIGDEYIECCGEINDEIVDSINIDDVVEVIKGSLVRDIGVFLEEKGYIKWEIVK